MQQLLPTIAPSMYAASKSHPLLAFYHYSLLSKNYFTSLTCIFPTTAVIAPFLSFISLLFNDDDHDNNKFLAPVVLCWWTIKNNRPNNNNKSG